MSRRGSRPALRLISLLAAFTVMFVLVAGRLTYLQVVQAEPLGSRGAKQRIRAVEIPAKRGPIVDRTGRPLAISSEARAIYADPTAVQDPAGTALTLAPLLGLAEEALLAKLTKTSTTFVYLARQVEVRVARQILALDLPAIGVLKESRRDYPSGEVAGQVLGFVGTDGIGLSGLEFAFDAKLRGKPGRQVVEQDPNGRPIPQGRNSLKEPVPGTGVALTIDQRIQYYAEQALARGVASTKADRGTAVVMDVRTGDVLAMANWPPVDPSSFGAADAITRRNRVVTDAYEPGSVNKVITAAAAIEAGLVTPGTMMKVPDRMPVAGRTFRDYEPHKTWKITYADVLARSSNVGTITVAQKLGRKRFNAALRRFGFGSVAGTGFPGESPGILADPEDWNPLDMATIPIGQSVAVTPLQVASVYQTIANDGVRLQPRVVRGSITPDGTMVPAAMRKGRRVVSAFTAAQVRGMLLGVAEHGTGRRARIPGYLIGGKTGTARVPLADRRGYSNEIVTTFAGMAPLDAPRLVTVVSLDDPRPRMAALTAAPIWREITAFALGLEQIVPAAATGSRAGSP